MLRSDLILHRLSTNLFRAELWVCFALVCLFLFDAMIGAAGW